MEMDSRKTGIICAVRGCHNNWRKRKVFLEQACFDHKPRSRNECGCDAPYDLHPPPKGEEAFRLWLKALKLKKPPKRPYVCSFHFVDGRPTEDHPYPEKWLGWRVAPHTGHTEDSTKMQKQCVIAGCREENTSLHTLPRDPKVKHEWLKFIYCQIPEIFSLNLTVCSAHFSADCFINLAQYSAGFAQNLRLKVGAVPTLVQPTTKAHQQLSTAIVASPCEEMSEAELELHQNAVDQLDQNPATRFIQSHCSIQQEGADLTREQLLNGGSKEYVCCVCGGRFAVLDELSEHFMLHKDEVRCYFCRTVFSHAVSLADHLDNGHSNELLFCRTCSITFTNIWHMNSHMGMHLQNRSTMDAHKESSPDQLTHEDFLCKEEEEEEEEEVEVVITQMKEEEVRALKEEEQEVMIPCVKEEEEEVGVERMVAEMRTAKTCAEYEHVNVSAKCVKEEEEQEITENREVDINNVKEEEEELGVVKEEDAEEALLETQELDKMVYLHDHTYFSVQHLPCKDTTDNKTDSGSAISEYFPSPFDRQEASDDEQSAYGTLHDHNYFSTQSLACPVGVQNPANPNSKDLPSYNNDSISSEDSKSEDDQQESPVDGQRVYTVSLDRHYHHRPTQTTRSSDMDTGSDQQPVSSENDQSLSCGLLDCEGDQEAVEECFVSTDNGDHYISPQDKSKNPPKDAEKLSPLFDSKSSKEGSPSLRYGGTGRNLVLKQACNGVHRKLVSSDSESLKVCTHCGLSKVPNLERPMEGCTCTPSFPRNLCRGTFGTKQLLVNHQADIHRLGSYLCARCLQLFPNQNTFSKHVCITSNLQSGESPKPKSANNALSMIVSHAKQPANGQHGSPLTVIKIVKSPQVVNTASSLSHSPSISDAKMLPGGAGTSLSCAQNQKVAIINGNQRRMIPKSGVSRPKLGQVLNYINFPQQQPTIGRHLPPAATSQVLNSSPGPAQVGAFPPSNIPLPKSQTPSSPQSPLKIVAMFVNQSQQLALEKRLGQSWRSKTAFPCRQCGAVSRQPSLGVRHRYQHRGPRHHRCQCGRAFRQRLHLLRHQVQHAEASRYVCATCGQTFSGTQQLANHLPRALFKITPSNAKTSARKVCRNVFQCPCGQAFARPAALLWHMLKNSKARKSRLKKSRPCSV